MLEKSSRGAADPPPFESPPISAYLLEWRRSNHGFCWFFAKFCANVSARFTMRALFRPAESRLVAARDPVHSDILEVHGAELASVYYGRRIAGDFCDFIRVSPSRVLFGLL